MGSSLPSLEQLAQLARDLYPGATIDTGSGENSTGGNGRDNDLAMEWNFISSPSFGFWLWSSEVSSKGHAYSRYFGSPTTYWASYDRDDSRLQAVCLAE